ncbi:sensor histidine kinase [Actinomadura nitritigenes]|uniref:sensor histidine kinase n=1 Tax=Actinomadura nitritigenes TaxID=134602 RepID=UPI003D8B665B
MSRENVSRENVSRENVEAGGRRTAAAAATGAAAVVPALIDQATTDTSAAAWLALGAYAAVAVAALSVRHRRPFGVFCAVLAVLAAVEVATAAAEVKVSGLAVLPPAFALHAVGAHGPRRRSAAALAVGGLLVAAGLLANHATAPDGWRGGSDVLAFVAVLPVGWALGVAAHGHRALLAAAERRADDARREQRLRAEQAAAAERVRIARDMHDVVAHSLTLLVVHAETMRARSGDLPAWARDRVDALAAAGREATEEMRDLLGVLRAGSSDAAPRVPAPSLSGLGALVDAARGAGNPAVLTAAGPLDELPRPVQLAAYRVVQEGLSNARRHAPGAPVTVRVEADAAEARVEVACGPPPEPAPPARGSGAGLAGLAERVAALDGRLHAAPAPGGGFRVAATVPRRAGGRIDARR